MTAGRPHYCEEPWADRGSAREHRQHRPEGGSIEFVEADLNSDAGWPDAVVGAEYVLHVASPVPMMTRRTMTNWSDRRAMGRFVSQGRARRGVKRVVMTSSISAIIYGRGVREKPFTEEDWTDEANRATHPPMIGPRPSPSAQRGHGWRQKAGDSNSSPSTPAWFSALCSDRIFPLRLRRSRSCWMARFRPCRVLASTWSTCATSRACIAGDDDAREAAGQRFIGSGDFYWMSDVAKILKQGFGDKAKKVPSFPVPDFVARIVALFDPIVRGRLFELGKRRPVSSEKARRMLGWTTRPVTETFSTPREAFRRRAWCRSTTSRAARSRARTATARRAVCHLLS